MNRQPIVSVIVPVYNVADFLPRCLDTLCAQTLKDIEIICVNDGSTDNCPKILQKYADKDRRIRLIDQTNQGLSEARNHAMDVAKGEYVFFLDSDDSLHPQALEIFYNVARKANVPVVIDTTFCRLGKEKPLTDNIDAEKIKFRIYKNPLRNLYTSANRHVSAVVWNKLYRADVIKNFRFIKGIYFEDWPWTACLFSEIEEFACFSEKLYNYNTISPSIVRSRFSTRKIHDYIEGIRFIHNYFKIRNKTAEWDIVRKKRIAQTLKMLLSKISKSHENIDELEEYFAREYTRLVHDGIVSFRDLTFKSKIRLWRLYLHQRKH